MIADEIQTGLGRTGKMLCCDWDQVRPDMVLLGKALSGGFYPVSCVLADNHIMDLIKPGQHGSTYGGNPLASSIVPVSVQVLKDEGMIENSLNLGKYFYESLQQIKSDKIVAVRGGKGLFSAIEFDHKNKKLGWNFCMKASELGLLAKQTHDTTVRFSPPLIIRK